MSEEKTKKDEPLNEEDIKKINDDIKKTQEELVSEQTKKVIETEKQKAREEVLKDVEAKKLVEEKEVENVALKKQLEEQEKKSAQQLDSIQKKVDDMVSSQSTSAGGNPFEGDNNDTDSSKMVDNWSKEKVDGVEEASARAFFGDDFDERI